MKDFARRFWWILEFNSRFSWVRSQLVLWREASSRSLDWRLWAKVERRSSVVFWWSWGRVWKECLRSWSLVVRSEIWVLAVRRCSARSSFSDSRFLLSLVYSAPDSNSFSFFLSDKISVFRVSFFFRTSYALVSPSLARSR